MPASSDHFRRISYTFLLLLLLSATSTLASILQSSFLTASGNPIPSICGLSVKNVVEIADVVFTGKVDSMVVDSQGLIDQVAIVRVKRILRSNPKYEGPEGIVSGNRVAAALSERFFDSAAIALPNCSHPDALYAVRIRDTKIFCARVSGRSGLAGSHHLHGNKPLFPFQLLAISLPVNLQILEQFAALEGEVLIK